MQKGHSIMIQNKLKVLFFVFFSLNLVVSGLYASALVPDRNIVGNVIRFVSVVAPAAMLACTIEELICKSMGKESKTGGCSFGELTTELKNGTVTNNPYPDHLVTIRNNPDRYVGV